MPKNKPMDGKDGSTAEKWVDTHCHLDSLDGDPEAALASAFDAGVAEIVNVGTNVATSRASLELAKKHSSVWAAVGVHPHDAKDADHQALQEVRRLASHPRVVAIGEIGLDFFRDHSPRDAQIEAFRKQLDIAGAAGKPVILHIREAHSQAFDVLAGASELPPLVFHCFSAGPEEAAQAVAMGGYVSFAGNISYKKSDSIREAAAGLPLDRILVETDAPYLAPMPHRGKSNQPAWVVEVGRFLAGAIGRSPAETAAATRANAHRVFGIAPAG